MQLGAPRDGVSSAFVDQQQFAGFIGRVYRDHVSDRDRRRLMVDLAAADGWVAHHPLVVLRQIDRRWMEASRSAVVVVRRRRRLLGDDTAGRLGGQDVLAEGQLGGGRRCRRRRSGKVKAQLFQSVGTAVEVAVVVVVQVVVRMDDIHRVVVVVASAVDPRSGRSGG